MKLLKRIFLLLLIGILLFTGYLFINMFSFSSRQVVVEALEPLPIEESAVARFSEAIRLKTISNEDRNNFDSAAFTAFNDFLQQSYPLTDSLLERKTFNGFSHLYTWTGSDPTLKPVVLLSHLDVVPIADESLWRQDPFSGKIVNDTIWGRGTLDDKIGVISIMEAVEHLLKRGFQPERTIMMAFGHDEEASGIYGAISIAAYLKEQGIKAEFVLDEGLTITQKLVPGVERDVALIGISEKGFATLNLVVNVEGGHSSMPKPETAIDILSAGIVKLKSNPFPAKLNETTKAFISHIGPEMSFPNKLVFANADIFSSVIAGIYEQSTSGNAMVRTTTAPTIFESGLKDNVIPLQASAKINFRILPGETSESVLERVKEVINDPRVVVTLKENSSQPSNVSSTDGQAYQHLSKTIKEIFPEVLVAPNLMIAATDSRHYEKVAENTYRFLPAHLNAKNLSSIHGINENIPVNDFKNVIRFYVRLIENSSGSSVQ